MNNRVEYTQVSGNREHLIFGNRVGDDDIVWSLWKHKVVHSKTV